MNYHQILSLVWRKWRQYHYLKGNCEHPRALSSKADDRIKALSANRSPDSVANSQRGTPNTMLKRNVIGVTRDYVRQVNNRPNYTLSQMQIAMMAHQKILLKEKEKEHQLR